MRKISIIVFVLSAISSCVIDISYRFRIYNDTDEDVYLVLSHATGEKITPVINTCYISYANDWRYIENRRRPWDEIIKDSAYLYIINPALIQLPTNKDLSQDDIDKITPDMILSRIILYSYQFYGTPSFHYPYTPKEDYLKPGEMNPKD